MRKIRFTRAEWASIETRAVECGRAPARYVREAALGAVPKVSRVRANAPTIRELTAIAATLQQLQALKRTEFEVEHAARSSADSAQCAACSEVRDRCANELASVLTSVLVLIGRIGR